MHVVVFTGGDFPVPEHTQLFWKNVSAPDFVIAADSGFDAALIYSKYFAGDYDFTPDLISGDMDSLKNFETKLSSFSEEKILRHNPYKDFTDTELALDFVYKRFSSAGHDSHSEDRFAVSTEKDGLFVTLVGGAGGRIDHLLGIFDIFSMDIRPSAWICMEQVLWFAPEKSLFEISGLKSDDVIAVSRLNGSRTDGRIVSQGLEWDSPCFRKQGMPSISNRISKKAFVEKKAVKISVEEGCFVIILPVTAVVKRTLP